MKICFATEVTYENYVHRIKQSSLKDYLELKLYESGIHYYIATNMPNAFVDYKNNSYVHVFDLDELRHHRPKSIQLELYPETPTGLYPSKYPWNCRRFIIEQAAKDGFDYIIYIDADVRFNNGITADSLTKTLHDNYEPNTVQTNSTIFRYKDKTPSDVFDRHDKHIEYFGFSFLDEQYDTIDGPCQVFIGKTNSDVLQLVDNWHMLAEFGYQSIFGYGNNKHGNLSFVIPMSNFMLKWKDFPFQPHHNYEDRYV